MNLIVVRNGFVVVMVVHDPVLFSRNTLLRIPHVVAANAHLVPMEKKRGGRRVKSSTPEPIQWTHDDAQEIADKLPLKSWRRWLGLQEGFESWFWVA